RMSIYDGKEYLVPVSGNKWAINRWNNGNEIVHELTHDIQVGAGDTLTLYFDIEYYENIVDNVISFESFKTPFGILPVEWGEISGNPCGEYNCIIWETIQEKSSSHFEVERSSDGVQWTGLGQTIPA